MIFALLRCQTLRRHAAVHLFNTSADNARFVDFFELLKRELTLV